MKILLTGGGTAGHAWPIVLVGQSLLRNQRVKLLYVGSRQGIEKMLAGQFKIPFQAIITGKRRAYFSLSNFWDIFKVFLGIIQGFFILLFFHPDVVFAKGGYVTVPIIFWAKIFKIPLVIHESDVVMGKANLWAAKFAKKICLGFAIEHYNQKLSLDKLTFTGIPVNPDFLHTAIKTGERPKLLITGGSQGSSKINNLVAQILPDLLSRYEIWHLAGKRDYQKLSESKNSYYHLFDFSYQMAKFMRDADLVITRAGANTLAEIAATAKPTIIIPLESAAGEHQEANAQVFQKNNAAVVLKEQSLTANSLKEIIYSLMGDEPMRRLLGHHAHGFFQPQATEEIVDCIFEAAKK